MPTVRGTLASFKADARAGIQEMLALQTQLSVDADGKVVGQQVRANYQEAMEDIIFAFLDVWFANEPNATIRNRITTVRAVLEA
jgi:hypothetical protein